MIRAVIRRLTANIENKVLLEQNNVKLRFDREKEQAEAYEIDPEDQGSPLGEYGFRVKGPEPTRYGDWERKGRVSDF